MALTKAQIAYRKGHLKRVPLDLQVEDYERLKAVADQIDEPVNRFIKTAINERIDKITKNQL